MDLVLMSLDTVFKEIKSLSKRENVCRFMLDAAQQSAKLHDEGLLSKNKLASLQHGTDMSFECTDWFILEMCDACGIKCMTENRQGRDIKCAKAVRCPFNVRGESNMVVWGVNLFNRIRMCDDEQLDRLHRTKMIEEGWKNFETGLFFENGLFLQTDGNHFTSGAIHTPVSGSGTCSVSWRCSMCWQPDDEDVRKFNRFMQAWRQRSPEWIVVSVPPQKHHECSARALLDLGDNIISIAQQRTDDPHCLDRDQGQYSRSQIVVINNNAHQLRTLHALALLKCMDAVGLFDFQTAWASALSTVSNTCHKFRRGTRGGNSEATPPADGGIGQHEASSGKKEPARLLQLDNIGEDTKPSTTYVSFPLHRLLVIHKIYWTAFLNQHKHVEFRIRTRLQLGMSVLLSLNAAERRLGNTDLLLARVKEVYMLPLEKAVISFPNEADDCELRRLCRAWGRKSVACIVVEEPRLAPEFVFLVPGNLGEMHQFSIKGRRPQFCHKDDEGKLVTVTDKKGKTVKCKMLNTFACCLSRSIDVKAATHHQASEVKSNSVSTIYLDYVQVMTLAGLPIISRGNVPAGHKYNANCHGTVTGDVEFHVGMGMHNYSLTRHVHATRDENSCGFIVLEVDAKNSVSDKVFMEAFQSRAPVAANRLKNMAVLCESDDLHCPQLRQHICCIMQNWPPDKCSTYWTIDPIESILQNARDIAASLHISVTDEGLTRGQKWAISVLSPKTQFDEGYRRVLADHFENNVGFLTVQKRMWTEEEIQSAQRRGTRSKALSDTVGTRYGHCDCNNEIPSSSCAIWVMCHIVADGDEMGARNHFEVLTTGDTSSSLFMLNLDHPVDKKSKAVLVTAVLSKDDTSTSTYHNDARKQAKISHFFQKVPHTNDGQQGTLALSEQGQDKTSEQGQDKIDSITECLKGGSQISSSADTAIRIYYTQCQDPGSNKHQGLKTIIRNLKRPNGSWSSFSLEEVQERVQEYIDILIYVSSVVEADERSVKQRPPLRAMLEWVLTVITPGGRAKIASDDKLHDWRESIHSLLQKTAPSEMCPDGAISDAVDQAAPECCFKCYAENQQLVWGCCHVELDGSQCRVGICAECMGLKGTFKPVDWHCLIHSKPGAKKGPKLQTSDCWECPRDPARCKTSSTQNQRLRKTVQEPGAKKGSKLQSPAKQNGVRCTECGLALCCLHGIVSELERSVQTMRPFRCWSCQTRETFAENVRLQLMRLLGKFTKFPLGLELCHFKSEHISAAKLGSQTNMDAAYAFVNLVYDAHHATLHEVAVEFIPVLIQVNLGFSSRFARMPSTPSQFLRILGGIESTVKGGPQYLQLISECAAREYVAQNSPPAAQGEKWACWIQPPVQPESGLLKMCVWLPFCSGNCPEVDLLAAIFTRLEERKIQRNTFSSIILCVRRLSGAKSEEESYDKSYGPCCKLIEHFMSRHAIKWFDESDGPEEIHAFFMESQFDVVTSVAGYSHGEICSVLSKKPRVAPLIVEMTAYAGLMWGITDFTWTLSKLNHPTHWNNPNRERAIINENPYPALGWHNGHLEPCAADIARIQVPEQGRSVLLFSGTLDKLSSATVHMYCRILAGTGNGLKSAVLAIICSTDLGVDSVRKWIKEYNSKVQEKDKVAASRLWIFPYRRKELFWAFLGKFKFRCLSVSTGSHYDVHTTAGDVIICCVPHLALQERDQMWPRNVAALLVEQVGLGQYLIADDEENFVQRAIWWLLNPHMLQAASEHMAQCQRDQLGYYCWMRMVEDIELGIPLAFAEVVRAKGDRRQLRDVDLTKERPGPPPCKTFMPAGAAPGFIVGESCRAQFLRLMNQISNRKLSFKGYDPLFEAFVHLHHKLGFRGMCIIGHGSSVICIWATYRGEGIPSEIDYGQEVSLKVPHYTKRNPRQENRIKYDPILFALRLIYAAGLRRKSLLQNILPKLLHIYGRGCAAGLVQHKGSQHRDQPARSRPVLCFAAFEYIPERSFYDSEIIKETSSEYRKTGIISDKMARIMQAVIFSTNAMNSRRCINMDLSWGNLSLRVKQGRFVASWLDTGGSVVIPNQETAQTGGTAMMRAATSIAALPDAGPANAQKTPGISISKESGIGYLDATLVRALYAQGPVSRVCTGTRGFRDEDLAAKFNAPSSQIQPLQHSDGCRFDSYAATMCCLGILRSECTRLSSESWEREIAAAVKSKDAMYEFLLRGTEAGAVQQPHLLDAFADMFYKSLRKDDRFSSLETLLSKALSTKIWSAAQVQAIKGTGIPFPSGSDLCPPSSKWRAQGCLLPKLTLIEEFHSNGSSMGVGVQTLNCNKKGDFLGFYAGTEASSETRMDIKEFPPCRYNTYAWSSSGARLHVIAEQPVDWFLEHNVIGPFLNAAAQQHANVELRRTDFWRDTDSGILYVGMYFNRDTAAGEFLRWHYDPFAGAGGIDAYSFPRD